MKYSLEDIAYLEQEYDDNYSSNMEQFQTSLETIEILSSIYQKCQELKNKPHVSIEDFENLKQYAEIGLGLEAEDTGRLFPSLESHSDLCVSIEEFDDSIKSKLMHALNVGLDQIKDVGRFVRYSINIINLLTKEYRQTNSKLNSVKDTTIKVGTNKYFCYGENKDCVNDTKDYIDKLKESASLLTVVADSMGNYTKNSFLDNLKVLFGYLTLQKNDVLDSMFDSLYHMTNTITNHPSMKEVQYNRQFDYKLYESDTMLGMYRAEVTQMDKTKDPDGLSLSKKRHYATYMALGVRNVIARNPIEVPNRLEFTFNQRDVNHIRDILLPLSNCYDKFNSNLLRLSLAEKLFNIFMMVAKTSLVYDTGKDAGREYGRHGGGSYNSQSQQRHDEWLKNHEAQMAEMRAQSAKLRERMDNLKKDKSYTDPFSFDNMDDFNKWFRGSDDAIEGEFTRVDQKRIGKEAIIPIGTIIEPLLLMFFANYRILMSASLMITSTNHIIFSLLRGHIKNAIEINKKLIAQQD